MTIFDIPIITYHKISSQKEFGLTTVTPQTFRKHLQLLADNRFQAITFKQFDSNQDLPEKPIIINFDDTYKSVYENAFPIMNEFNFKGVLFVIADYMGKKNDWEAYPIQRKHYHANQDEITEMHEFGFEIGTHSKTHKYLPHLKSSDIATELSESKTNLENTFNTNIITCCYPYGGYNEIVINTVKDAGYSYGMGNLKLSTEYRTNNLCLQRRSIYSTDSLTTFYKKVNYDSKCNLNLISEWLIQKGAFAGILKNNIYKFNVKLDI